MTRSTVKPKPAVVLRRDMCRPGRSKLDLVLMALILTVSVTVARGQLPPATDIRPADVVRLLEDDLEQYAAKVAQEGGNLSGLPDSVPRDKWAQFAKSDIESLVIQTRLLILSTQLEMHNRKMDELITSLLEAESQIKRLQEGARRFVSALPMWATAKAPDPGLESRFSADEGLRRELICSATVLMRRVSRALNAARALKGQILTQQQDTLQGLIMTRSEAALARREHDGATATKEAIRTQLLDELTKNGSPGALTAWCQKWFLQAILDAETGSKPSADDMADNQLPKRLSAPLRSVPEPGQEGPEQPGLGPVLLADPLAPVFSVAKGKVALSDYVPGFGLTVAIQHGPELTVYGHLAASFVKRGQMVASGQTIGLAGQTGLAGRASLLLATVKDGRFSNPLKRINWPGSR